MKGSEGLKSRNINSKPRRTILEAVSLPFCHRFNLICDSSRFSRFSRFLISSLRDQFASVSSTALVVVFQNPRELEEKRSLPLRQRTNFKARAFFDQVGTALAILTSSGHVKGSWVH